MYQIGITERGDPAFDHSWMAWVRESNPAILISKSPDLIWGMIYDIPNINVIVHATITGYGATVLEPYVPKPEDSLAAFERLIDLLGEDRVVLRVDPIIPTDKGFFRAWKIMEKAREIAHTRIRISFLDLYPHVKKRFQAAGITPPPYDFHAPEDVRIDEYNHLNRRFGQIEVCGEPGLPVTGCISDIDCQILGVKPMENLGGQRRTCACFGNKYELLKNKNQCEHGCLYCYWKK